jgi:hypothetical protein
VLEGLGKRKNTVSSLTALTTLNLSFCNVSDEVLQALSSLTALQTLSLWGNDGVTDVQEDVGLQELCILTFLTSLDLRGCPNVTAAAKQALRTDLPNLTIMS